MAQNFNFAKFSDEKGEGVAPHNSGKDPEQPNPATPSMIETYRSHFEVDTQTVIYRIKKTLWPFDRSKFFENKADLYGAIWVPTTLIFLLSVVGSAAARLTDDKDYTFNPSALVVIASMIYFFIFSVPALLSFFLLPIDEVSFTELLSLYGYSYFMFCPAAIISVLQFTYVRWISFGASSVWAGILLTKNYYNQINSSEGWRKYLTIIISLSGYAVVTLTANVYLFK